VPESLANRTELENGDFVRIGGDPGGTRTMMQTSMNAFAIFTI
jgi:hypothetical protein